MSDAKVDENKLIVWVRPGVNAGNYRVHIDNNPMYEHDAAERLDPSEFQYALEANGSLDLSFDGTGAESGPSHHFHGTDRGRDQLDSSGGYKTVLMCVTSDGFTSARLTVTAKNCVTVHDFNIPTDFPV